MKKLILALIAAAICTFTFPAFAENDQAQEFTALDTVLADGMTVAETLQEWDNSAMRYHSEPPEMEIQQQESVEEASSQS